MTRKMDHIRFGAWVTPEQKARIEKEAWDNRMNQSEYLRYILKDYWAAREARLNG